MKSGKQITAARALLGWTVEELSHRCGLSSPTIVTTENETRKPKPDTIKKIIDVFRLNGVNITDHNVGFIDNRVTYLTDPNWWFDILDDVYFTLEKSERKELLIFSSNDRLSPQKTVEQYRRLIKSGVRIRQMVEEGNTYLMGEETDYRWIPSRFYYNQLILIYDNKVCNDFDKYGLLINDANWAHSERNRFEMAWSFLPEPNGKSTADVRF